MLTGVAGVVDALSILRLDRVFVANITGNIIFIGLALVGARGYSITAPLIVFASFLAGAAGAGAAAPRLLAPPRPRGARGNARATRSIWRSRPACSPRVPIQAPPCATRCSSCSRSAWARKSALVRAVDVPGLTTSVFTSTLTGLAADATRGGWRSPGFAVRIIAALALLVGAVVGAVLALKTYAWCALAFATAALVPTVAWSRAAAQSTRSLGDAANLASLTRIFLTQGLTSVEAKEDHERGADEQYRRARTRPRCPPASGATRRCCRA